MSKFVYFDLGNVLINFDHSIALQKLCEASGESPESVQRIIFESNLQNEYETGLISSHDFATTLGQQLQVSLSSTEILEIVSDIFELNEPILPVLEWLKESKIPTAILSNTCEAHWQWILKQGWELPGDWFDFHVLSFEVHSMKPDSGIYEFCEDKSGRSPTDLFFTDDREENIQAALSRGWSGHLFRSASDLRSHLAQWLASPSDSV